MPKGSSAFEELYQRGQILGRGASGVAFVVRPKEDPQSEYVAKEICVVRSDEKRRRDAFLESQLLSELHHNNIVKCFRVFLEEEMMYIVMEYATGGDLAQRIQARRAENLRFSEQNVMCVFVQICAALHYLHSRKVVHRDLKPPNVFVVGEGELHTCTVKVGDFGIAKIFDCTMGQAHSTVGTPSYLSPEICKNNPYGMKSDIWSLGIILYELACLKVPFQAGNLPAMAYMICTSEPKPLPEEFGTALSELVRALLQKDPANRPPVSKVLQNPYVYRLLPDDIRLELDAGLDSTTASMEQSSTVAAATVSGTAASALQPVIESALSSSSSAGGWVATHANAKGLAPPAAAVAQPIRGGSQPSRSNGRSQGGGEPSGGSRLPSCGPHTRKQDKHMSEEGWCWRRASDVDRQSVPGSGGKGSRPTPRGGGTEKDRSRAAKDSLPRPRMERIGSFGASGKLPSERGERPEKAERAPTCAADHSDRSDHIDQRAGRTKKVDRATNRGYGVDRSGAERADRGDRGERGAVAKSSVNVCSGAGGSEAERRDSRSAGSHNDGACHWDAASGLWTDQTQGSRNFCSWSNPGGTWNGSDVTLELVVTPEQSGIADTDDDRPLCESGPLAPPAELQEPSPPFAEPPSSSGFVSILHSGAAEAPRMRARICRRGRPPLLAGQETADADVLSPPRQRPSAKGLEAAGSSPGEHQTGFQHTAPISSVAAPFTLSAVGVTRSVSPTRRAAALKAESCDFSAPGPVLRSSGSAPALPPLPPLVAPGRGVVRSRSVVALHDASGRGHTELPRHGAPNFFRTAPLPISERERSAASCNASASYGSGAHGANAYGSTGSCAHSNGDCSTSVCQGPSPPLMAPPPQQPPPPQRQPARDEPSAVRLAPKLPSTFGSQLEGRSGMAGRESSLTSLALGVALGMPSRELLGSREAPPTVLEGWGDVDPRLASARLQSVV